mgnify:CR=1 FL=1
MSKKRKSPLYRAIAKATKGLHVSLREVSEVEIHVEGNGAQTASRLIEDHLLNSGKGYFVEYFQSSRPQQRGYAHFSVRKHDEETMYTA